MQGLTNDNTFKRSYSFVATEAIAEVGGGNETPCRSPPSSPCIKKKWLEEKKKKDLPHLDCLPSTGDRWQDTAHRLLIPLWLPTAARSLGFSVWGLQLEASVVLRWGEKPKLKVHASGSGTGLTDTCPFKTRIRWLIVFQSKPESVPRKNKIK